MYRTIICLVLFYGCETWSRTLREERRLRVLEKRMLREIFGSEGGEITGVLRRLHNVELHDLHSSPNFRVMNARRLDGQGIRHVWGRGEMRTGLCGEA